MYHAIVAVRIRELFRRLGQEDYTLVLDSLAPSCEHSFLGNTRLAEPAGRLRRSNAGMSVYRACCLAFPSRSNGLS